MCAKLGITTQPGISNQPAMLPYPRLQPFGAGNAWFGHYCYLVKHYGSTGLSCLISIRDGRPTVQVGDWSGRVIDLADSSDKLWPLVSILLDTHLAQLVALLEVARVPQAIAYFAAYGDPPLILVDVRLSLNKMSGPGMIKDVFGKVIPTQEVIDIKMIDANVALSITAGNDKYSGNIIVKPSIFKCLANSTDPLYAEVLRW